MRQSGDWKIIVNTMIISIIKYLVIDSQLLVYEKPLHKTTEPRDQIGFRPSSRNVGDARMKKLNYHFQLISPSYEELKIYIEKWVLKESKKNTPVGIGIPENDVERIQLGMKFMDDFVNEYYVLLKLSPRTKGDYYLGYCPENKDSNTAITHHIKIQNIKRSELEKRVGYWSSNYLSD